MLFNILIVCILFICSFLITTFLGYWVHWALHQKWSGSFYEAHMNHHLKQYPALDFYSDTYRSAGKDNTVFLFLIIFSPILIGLGLFSFFFSPLIGLSVLISLLFFGIIHNYYHDQFHIKKSIWRKFSLFIRLERLHMLHHINMNYNYGIIYFIWDKVFNTFNTLNNYKY